jgi:hypothetical protein
LHYEAASGKLNEIGFAVDADGEIMFDPDNKQQSANLEALQEIF